MQFTLENKDKSTRARTGTITTGHGEIKTPFFMPVGTAGTVKAVHQRELHDDVRAQIMLANTYHLYLRPGTDVIAKAGGLHKFINWSTPILTDSGGYQVFSLAENRKLSEDGAVFSSHIDGSKHKFTPENIVDIQRLIGADIMMAFDECVPYPCDHRYAAKSTGLTHRWLERGFRQYTMSRDLYGYTQAFFPIVQGSTYPDLRRQSATEVTQYDAQGYAIGGLSVGEPENLMYEMVEIVTEILPEDKPRYLMGVGTPVNILESISRGIDMFDCVIPTRNGRNGMLFTRNGVINIRNRKWKDDFSPVDEHGIIFADTQYSRAYLRHLVISGEILGAQIATLHNLGFFMGLMEEARRKITEGIFGTWKKQMIQQLSTRL
ncbi:MAG: tRNA guanosine(34) transglycosylase Tgt [Bacteroidales bacterium]|nr:tRNA guanosine(34) transglycosylase Tgt [Bacteroidales bacterium]